MHVQPTEWWGEWGRCVVKCGVTESVEIGVCVHLSVTVRTMRALRLCVSVCASVCVCVSVCASFCVCVPWMQSEVNQY